MNHRPTPSNTLQSRLRSTQRHAFVPLFVVLIAVLSAPALAQTPEAPLGCLIQPNQVADVGSSVIGLLESVKVERGDFVQKGQILATLRTEVEQAALGVAQRRADAEANLRAAEAEQGYARQRLARSEDLQRQNFLSDQALDQHRTDAKVADQRLAQAREQRDIWEREYKLAQVQLQQRVIRSPFSGVVIDRFRYPGERIEEKPILRLASLDPLRVEVYMPASRYGSFKPGMTLQVAPELPGASARPATITRIDRVIDPASNSFRVQLRLPNAKHALPAGLRCKILDAAPADASAVKARPAN